MKKIKYIEDSLLRNEDVHEEFDTEIIARGYSGAKDSSEIYNLKSIDDNSQYEFTNHIYDIKYNLETKGPKRTYEELKPLSIFENFEEDILYLLRQGRIRAIGLDDNNKIIKIMDQNGQTWEDEKIYQEEIASLSQSEHSSDDGKPYRDITEEEINRRIENYLYRLCQKFKTKCAIEKLIIQGYKS